MRAGGWTPVEVLAGVEGKAWGWRGERRKQTKLRKPERRSLVCLFRSVKARRGRPGAPGVKFRQ